MNAKTGFRCGTIALLGRPNAGKSTLINRIIGSRIAIVTPKPQTTRHRILGIHTDEQCQMIFVDTPGIHRGGNRLNRNMVRMAHAAAAEADVLIVLQDVTRSLDTGTRAMIRHFAEVEGGKPRIHVLNKVDRVAKPALLPRLAETRELDVRAFDFIPLSALKGTQVQTLLESLYRCLPEGPPVYAPDWYTDQSQRQLAAEYVREQVFLAMHQEIPFQTAVAVERFLEQREGYPGVEIDAVILVGNERHKPMLLGRGGGRIKAIGSEARRGLERLLGCRVRLNLWVKVQPDWFDNPHHLRELGLGG